MAPWQAQEQALEPAPAASSALAASAASRTIRIYCPHCQQVPVAYSCRREWAIHLMRPATHVRTAAHHPMHCNLLFSNPECPAHLRCRLTCLPQHGQTRRPAGCGRRQHLISNGTAWQQLQAVTLRQQHGLGGGQATTSQRCLLSLQVSSVSCNCRQITVYQQPNSPSPAPEPAATPCTTASCRPGWCTCSEASLLRDSPPSALPASADAATSKGTGRTDVEQHLPVSDERGDVTSCLWPGQLWVLVVGTTDV